jgi:precorrin-6B methylase 2
MIENFIKFIINKNEEYVIFDIGSRDCLQSIEFYNIFPNAKIYAFECNPNTLEICRKNIENYKDRIFLIEGAVCDYDGEITFYPINQKKPKLHGKMVILVLRLYLKVMEHIVMKYMCKMKL